MSRELNSQKLNCINENIIDELLAVESLIKTTVNNCMNRECNTWNSTEESMKKLLSEERNDYINILTLALEKIKHVQLLNDEIEDLILKSII